MAEYRSLRAKHSMLALCKTPELAAQVTLQPIDRFPVDAAIIFADILLPLEAMGLDLEFAEGEGPVIHNPVRERADVERLKAVDGAELEYVAEAIRQTRQALHGRVPLIGFAGPVQIAVVTHRSNPADGEWRTASWDNGAARILIGPGTDTVLTAGDYKVWVRVDPPGAEDIVRKAGVLSVI